MTIRTIAVFHCEAFPGSAWCCGEGVVRTLEIMGFDVLNCGRPQWTEVPIETLRRADLIIMTAVEWYDELLAERYGPAWFDLPARKAAWYAESAHRDDRDFPFGRVRPLADLHYFPAIQDAEEFGGRWLPFGADETVFRPWPTEIGHTAAFLGSLYPKRVEYMARVGYPLTVLPVVFDEDRRRGFELLAEAYCATRIFVNLPSYSRLLVTKITEVMACRTMLITPAMDHPTGLGNMDQFMDGRHLVYYDPGRPEALGDLIEHYLARPDEVAAIADAGWREIHRGHTLRHRLRQILADAEAIG